MKPLALEAPSMLGGCCAARIVNKRRRRQTMSVVPQKFHNITVLTAATAFSLGLHGCTGTSDPADESIAIASQELQGSVACTAAQLAELLKVTDDVYDVKCSFTLPAGSTIYRPLRFYGDAADGVTVDCNGSLIGHGGKNGLPDTHGTRMIEIRSKLTVSDGSVVKKANGYYERQRPEQITIKDCSVHGTVRIYGLGVNGEAEYVRQSSIDSAAPGHPARARDAAPYNVVLNNVTIHGGGGVPLYLSPGVTRVQLLNSTISGNSTGAGIYLDTESANNIIRNNEFTLNTGREIIAVDGSSGNLIVNNQFPHPEYGGIHLYRNCGEGGTVRWSGPHHNQFINNFFGSDYHPSIMVASRDGDSPHCDEDDGYDFGSSKYNWDYARYNAIMQNQMLNADVAMAIFVKHSTINSPNYVEHNQSVTARIVRKAGCYLPTGFAKDFILDDQTATVTETQSGSEVCVVKKCIDGVLSDVGDCTMTMVPFGCSKSGSNAGCNTSATCPSGTKIIGAKAACNLETTDVTADDLESTPAGIVDVVQLSDNTSDGKCIVGDTTVVSRDDVVRGPSGATSLTAHCEEHDNNGGECAVKGVLYCK
ncbi:right-handed parallel beta-helix repeat-containing protein [Polyangium jinanense]|uniref:Right-handed parallel beta-helix repeat-containing protein n=1 Tax=Polyangium jinanense TaxID=2829994 RepID=A0A9X3XG26_9BACT|nr:right-handed parallel beta-helix repeat-containing protein [Polyangium jinanense]MDC3962531.1 right-handed parallel beta-helix repeat-containing protein [Polyangium jinanense]MDC3989352.1 right-handed parallel beta-helix repeat-containing protein [Polyangium jinanense]